MVHSHAGQLTKIVKRFSESAETISLGSALVVVAVLLALFVPRRRLAVLCVGLSTALIVTLTIVQPGGWQYLWVHEGGVLGGIAAVRPHLADLLRWTTSVDGLLNVALYLPLGLALTHLFKRPAVTMATGSTLSYLIEVYQATFTSRVGSFEDVVANGVGAGAGTLLAIALTQLDPHRRGRRCSSPPVTAVAAKE